MHTDWRRLEVADQLLSEIFLLSDHPEQPMLVRIFFRLSPEIDPRIFLPENYRAATAQFFEKYPRWSGAYQIKCSGVRWHAGGIPAQNISQEMINRVWEFQNLNFEDFFHQAILATQAPLFRLKLNSQDGLCLSIHHALTDARGALHLLFEFLRILLGTSECSMERSKFRAPRKPPEGLLSSFKIFRSMLKDQKIRKKFPPVLLGNRNQLFGSKHSFFLREFSIEEAETLLRNVRQSVPELSFHDFLLGCMHLALNDNLKEQHLKDEYYGGRDRLSLLVPVDMRGRMAGIFRAGDIDPVANLSSMVSIPSFANERSNSVHLLRTIQARMAGARQSKLDRGCIARLQVLKAIGLFRNARKFQVRYTLPRRAFKGQDTYWRWMDTALATYVGRSRLPKDLEGMIRTMGGFPPIIPPMCIGVTVAKSDRYVFGFHSNDASISRQRSEEIADRVLYWFRELGQFRHG